VHLGRRNGKWGGSREFPLWQTLTSRNLLINDIQRAEQRVERRTLVIGLHMWRQHGGGALEEGAKATKLKAEEKVA
jgi:hypothetical protein